VCRYNDALAGENRGDEIGERFAGAGSGFDDQMAMVVERGFDSFRHFELTGAEFVSGMAAREEAAFAEELAHGEFGNYGRHAKPV
jgi:hypothetical protein